MSNLWYFTFPTMFFALKAERVLQNTPCPFAMVPVPRALSTSCGIALRCEKAEVEPIKKVLQEHNVSYSGIHCLAETRKQLARG